MVATNLSSFKTLTLVLKMATSSLSTVSDLAASLAMTSLGSVSGIKHMITANPKAMITLIRYSHLKPRLVLSETQPPTGEPILGPTFALMTKRAIAWPAPSTSPKRSAIVPATLERAVEPAVPQRNMKMISIGRLRAYAHPCSSSQLYPKMLGSLDILRNLR